MKKYEIYQTGEMPLLTIVEADDFVLRGGDGINRLVFYNDDEDYVAMFNFDNIAGFKEVSGSEGVKIVPIL